MKILDFLLNNRGGTGLRISGSGGLGRARALHFRARVGSGLGPYVELKLGRARALDIRARVGSGLGLIMKFRI